MNAKNQQSNKKRQLVCLSNQTTNGVRYYLRQLSTNPTRFKPKEVLSIIDECFKSSDKKSKWLVHNIFFLHLDILELETVKQHYFSLSNLDYDPISIKYYVTAIFKLRLHKYFLQVMSIIGDLEFAQRIFSLVINPIVEKKRRLRIKEWLCYLITVARLNQKQQQQQLNGFSYKEACYKLLQTFIELPSDQMTNLAKAQVLMRFAGTICLKESDYEQHHTINTAATTATTTTTNHNNSNEQQQIEFEISDLLKELKYDRTLRSSKNLDTVSVFQNFLSIINDMENKKEEKKSKKKNKNKKLSTEAFPLLTNPLSSTNTVPTSNENNFLDDILHLIGNTLNELKLTDAEMAHLENEHLLHGAQRRLVHFIGNCAYLTTLILKKKFCSSTVNEDGIGKILSFSSWMEKYKPKSRCEDYDTRNMTFSEFCQHFCSSKVKYQMSWFEKFLTYDESLSSPEGIKLATQVIAPKVNLTLGLEMVKRIMKLYHSSISTGMPLEENIKELLLTLIFSNEDMYKELGKIINMIFKKELHTKFCTVGFSTQLNDCNAKLGAENCFDVQSQQLSISCVKACQRLALQNPKETCQSLLLRTMQLPRGGAELLNALRPFFNLPFTQKQLTGNVNVDASQLSTSNNNVNLELNNLFECCLYEICILVTGETMRNMQTKLAKFVPHIIRLEFITMEKFASILKSMLISFNEKESCDKLGLLVEIYGSLVDCALNNSSIIMIEKQNALLKDTDWQKNPNNKNGHNDDEKRIEFLNDAYYQLNGLSVAAIFSERKEIHDLRDKCLNICCKIKEAVPSSLRNNNQGFPSEETLEDYDWVKRLLLYIRKRDDEKFRESFRQMLKSGQFFIPLQEESSTSAVINKSCPTTMDVAVLIRNTSSSEWNDLIEILYEVFYHFHDESNKEQAAKHLCSIFLKIPLFDLLYEEKLNGLDKMTDSTTTTTTTKSTPSSSMNPVPSVVYQKFCHYVVSAIVEGHLFFSRMSHHSSLYFAYQLVYSFVSCLANYPDNDEYLPVKRLTFLSLLNLCPWIMSKNPNENFKADIIEWLQEIGEEQNGKHGPFYGSLLTVFKSDPQSQTLITHYKLSSENNDVDEEENLDINPDAHIEEIKSRRKLMEETAQHATQNESIKMKSIV